MKDRARRCAPQTAPECLREYHAVDEKRREWLRSATRDQCKLSEGSFCLPSFADPAADIWMFAATAWELLCTENRAFRTTFVPAASEPDLRDSYEPYRGQHGSWVKPLLPGRFPFEGSQQLSTDRSLEALFASRYAALGSLVAECCSEDPSQRPPARELVRRLKLIRGV
jgi:hypothetical protein